MNVERTIEFLLSHGASMAAHAASTDARLDKMAAHAASTDARLDKMAAHGASTDARLDKIGAILRRAIQLAVQRDRTLRAAQRRTDRRFDQLINILAKSGGNGRRR